MKTTLKLLALMISAGSIASCGGSAEAPEPADTLLRGGAVYTLNPEQPWADAVAVRDGSDRLRW